MWKRVEEIGKLLCVMGLIGAVGCQPIAPAPPVPHNAVDVSASFGRTWDALIDQFAARNIPIKTIDRSSGLIATDALKVDASVADASDCGKDWMSTTMSATDATYNALVRGDSTRSTLRVTIRWVRAGPSRAMGQAGTFVSEECSTRGTWESDFESRVKAAAENKKP